MAEGLHISGATIIDSFDDASPQCVISDHPMAQKLEKAKKDDPLFKNEKMLKIMPALLRQAVNRNIKVRTPERFLNQMNTWLDRQGKTTSATTSNSTIRGKPSFGRENSAKIERTTPRLVPRMPRVSSDQTSSRPKEERCFLRIDVPGKRPEIRNVSKESFSIVYSGRDTGFSIFKAAESSLVERRQREYDSFLKGKYEPSKKTFKFDERDNYCQFCQKTILGDRKDHERTDEHRNKARTQGITQTMERIVLNARLRAERQEAALKRNQRKSRESVMFVEKSKRANVEYEYGENEIKANWLMLKANTVEKTTEKTSILSPRRRQKRMRSLSSQGDI